MSADLAAVARQLAERTRQAQGLPATITDPSALRRLGVLISDPRQVKP
jgi:hypothetical protein